MNAVRFFVVNLKKVLPVKYRIYLSSYKAIKSKVTFKDLVFKFKPYYDQHPGSLASINIYRKLFSASKVQYIYNYIYPFDPYKVRVVNYDITLLASITPDYKVLISSNLYQIEKYLLNYTSGNAVILLELINVIALKAKQIKEMKGDERLNNLASLFPNLLYRDCISFDEALQKILFYNALFWQVRHWHNGLGRLDHVLYSYYVNDIRNGVETYESAKLKLKDFCLVLGYQTVFKSLTLTGDTGQYILLGGVDEHGNNVDNELTRMFLELFAELKVADPKLIFRVNDSTSENTWKLCVKCLFNGCGSPLLMNEKLIMENMIKFGYSSDDVWNVGTSACWEPLVIGKSSCQNNPFRSVIACNALDKVLNSGKQFSSFSELLDVVVDNLRKDIPLVVKDLNYDFSPLMTLFDKDCVAKNLDFSHRGTKYMFQGVQILSFPNLINSLLNIKKYVYEDKILSLNDCRQAIVNNFVGYEDLRILFMADSSLKFGSTSSEVVNLCNYLISKISDSIAHLKANGNSIKFGLSSPGYISLSYGSPATLDGRRENEPYAVHISPVSSSIDINEVLQFASKLEYPYNCLNGNVVDFIIPSTYQRQPEKLASIIKHSFSSGLYQLQLNVLDRNTLMDAKLHPEKHPNLIVRVWGFSAYFNDLPEEYKDNLISRAEIYEKN